MPEQCCHTCEYFVEHRCRWAFAHQPPWWAQPVNYAPIVAWDEGESCKAYVKEATDEAHDE